MYIKYCKVRSVPLGLFIEHKPEIGRSDIVGAAALETLGPPLFNIYLLQTVQRCTRRQNNSQKCSVLL